MISEKTAHWINVIIRFFDEPEADIVCPNCGRSDLKLMDIRGDNAPGLFEREIYCPACGEKAQISCRECSPK